MYYILCSMFYGISMYPAPQISLILIVISTNSVLGFLFLPFPSYTPPTQSLLQKISFSILRGKNLGVLKVSLFKNRQ